jgi:hypothetical protein
MVKIADVSEDLASSFFRLGLTMNKDRRENY